MPVHHAVIRLKGDGLVEVLPRKGILILALSPDDLSEIYKVIVAVEGRAAELIAGFPEAEYVATAKALTGWTDARWLRHRKVATCRPGAMPTARSTKSSSGRLATTG